MFVGLEPPSPTCLDLVYVVYITLFGTPQFPRFEFRMFHFSRSRSVCFHRETWSSPRPRAGPEHNLGRGRSFSILWDSTKRGLQSHTDAAGDSLAVTPNSRVNTFPRSGSCEPMSVLTSIAALIPEKSFGSVARRREYSAVLRCGQWRTIDFCGEGITVER